MANNLLVTTSGVPATVVINDLGALTLVHPQVNFPLVEPLGPVSIDEAEESLNGGDLDAAIVGGEVTVTDENGNPISPGASLSNFVSKTGDEDVDGVKSFIQNIFVDAAAASSELEMGYFPSVVPNCYGVRTTGAGFYYCMGPNAINPQIVLGSPSAGGTAYFDTDAARPLLINVLNTGTGLGVNGRGPVTIGQGALTVGSFNAATAPNLTLTTETGGTNWQIYTGSPGNFDNWLRFSAVGSGVNNEAVLLPDGVWRTRQGVAGSPAHGFIDASNYGMYLGGADDLLGFSTAGTPRLTIDSGGDISVEGNDIINTVNITNQSGSAIGIASTANALNLSSTSGGTTVLHNMNAVAGNVTGGAINGGNFAGYIITTTAFNLLFAGASEFQLNSSSGTAGQVFTTQGTALPPVWDLNAGSEGYSETNNGSDNAINYNNVAATKVTFSGTNFVNRADFTWNAANNSWDANVAGQIAVSTVLNLQSSGLRNHVTARFVRDRSAVLTTKRVGSTYMRNGNGHNRDTLSGTQYYDCQVGDQFYVEILRDGTNTTATNINDFSNLSIRRIG